MREKNNSCIYDNVFEWDVRKALINYVKHKVTFEEAATVFGDPSGMDGNDELHS